MHWVVSKDQPSLEILHTLYEAYPEAVFERDNAGLLPFDKYGCDECIVEFHAQLSG